MVKPERFFFYLSKSAMLMDRPVNISTGTVKAFLTIVHRISIAISNKNDYS